MVKRPKLVVFDLGTLNVGTLLKGVTEMKIADYTLWPFYVDSYVSPPFHKKDNQITDCNGRSVECYPDVPAVLEMLHKERYPMGVASRTREFKGANQLIKLFGWAKFLVYREIYPGCKVAHFYSLKSKSGVEFGDMVFFDDEQINVDDVSEKGVLSVLVTHGINAKLVEDALEEFANKPKE